MHEDGTWTKERNELHNTIIDKILATATPVDNPVAYMMGGGPASGKSMAIREGGINMPENMVLIDSDDIKKSIPEYAAMIESGDSAAAVFAHEESSYISKRILKEATDGRYNTLLDGTGNGGINSLRKKIHTMKAGGNKVHANYVTVDTETAVARNTAREKKTGRLVPEHFVRYAHAQVSTVVPKAIQEGLFDKFNLFDTNVSGKLVKVAEARGTKFKVHDKALWDKFLAKGHE